VKNTKTIYIVAMSLLILGTSLAILLLTATIWLLNTWDVVDFNQLLFHLVVPLGGTDPAFIWSFVWQVIPFVLLPLILGTFILMKSLKNDQMKKKNILAASFGVWVITMFVALNYAWFALDIGTFVANQRDASTFIVDHYVDPRSVEITFPEQPRNLIYIYLESVETTFMSVEEGGSFEVNLIPELTYLAQQHVSFSGTDLIGGGFSTFGTTWTMGGMFAQTSGLPLILPLSNVNAMDRQEVFMPEIMTLGGILEEQGYRQVVMMGSDATFGGRRNYFTQHGNYEIWDLHTARELGRIPPDYFVFWGFEDELLFEFAQDKLTELGEGDQPFNFTMLTVDTHFEDGFVSEICEQFDEFSEQKANVLACSSWQVYEFVRWIQAQPWYYNTTIVIVADHLTMQTMGSSFWEYTSTYAAAAADLSLHSPYRTVYNVIINPAREPMITNGRPWSTLDMFPTTLSSLGVNIEGDRLGLGVNLFSDQETLVSQFGIEYLNQELQRRSLFFENFTRDIVVDE